MSSQSDQENSNVHPPKKQNPQNSNANNQPPPQPPPESHSPAPGYPQAMGYPYAPGQYNYPPNYPNGYNPHNHPLYFPPPQPSTRPKPSGFLRGVLIGIVFLVFFLGTTSIITWLVLRPQIPAFHLDAFSVSNFNASSSSTTLFTAKWDANVTVRNPNTRLKVYFDEVGSFVYYDDSLLGEAFSQPFYLETRTEEVVWAEITGNGTDPAVEKAVVERMATDRGGGTVRFSLRMAFLTTFKSGSWWTRQATLKVYCEDLKVTFGVAANGDFAGGKDCFVLS